jgi:hypothetical protein
MAYNPNGKETPPMDVRPGDKLLMKKQHPCGNNTFLVLRSGMDFRIRCTKCGHEIIVPRLKCEKNVKKIIRENTQDEL